MNSRPRPHTNVDFLRARDKVSHPAHTTSDEQHPKLPSAPAHKLPLESALIKSSRKRYRSPKDEGDYTGGLESNMVQSYNTNNSEDFKIQMGSPWGSYTEVLDLHLGGLVTIAERKAPHHGLVAIQKFPSTAAEKALERHQRVKHENIVAVLDAFTTDTSLYIVREHLPISLEQIVEGVKYPNERQLAAILKQVLCGLVYLDRENFQHGSLNCSTILLNTQGNIKIANLQFCEIVDGKGEPLDVRALSTIMMELMQKYVKDDGAIGVDNLHRWPSNCDAVAFLSETISAASALELQNHALLRRRTRKEDLIGLIFSAEVSAPRNYSCSA